MIADGIAQEILGATGLSPPIDLLRVARALDVEVRSGMPRRDGSIVYAPLRADRWTLQWFLAHEVGHYLIDRASEEQSEELASAVGAALLVPRETLRTDGTLPFAELVAKYSTASPIVIARRFCEVHDEARISVWTPGGGTRLRAAFGPRRDLKAEKERARAAFEGGEGAYIYRDSRGAKAVVET